MTLLVFVDGVGVGDPDAERNPLQAADLPTLKELAGAPSLTRDHLTAGTGPGLALDARLGVDGLPQSGTGQTSIFTGENAPALLGRHLGPYPNLALRSLLSDVGLWTRLAALGAGAAFANAFPDAYLERAARGKGRMGAIARSAHDAGIRLRGPVDLREGRAVSAFITNVGWREHLNYTDIPRISPLEAGRNLARVVRENDFTVFEFYATDLAGHRQDRTAAIDSLEMLDRMVEGALAHLPADTPVMVVSDHGNVEQLDTPRHTLNAALGIWRGPALASPMTSLTDVAEEILAAVARRIGAGTATRPQA